MTIAAQIHDEEGRSLLDTIDEIRQLARIPNQIELPQIIVVGQQSSGKSSVLRAVSRIPFPTQSGLCTQFAIEVCCRRHDVRRTAARIAPFGSVDKEKLQCLEAFEARWKQVAIETEDQVKTMIEEARVVMGLRARTGFSFDRLVVEIQGPTQEHLTIIDLPGLINSGGKAEVKHVDGLVARYLNQAHTIILAVIHGFADAQNQRTFDLLPEHWSRAIGVITAADMIYWDETGGDSIKSTVSPESEQTPRYGWHIVRNLDPAQARAGKDRDQVENEFFAGIIGTARWKGMERVLCGIEPLRQKLSKTLKELIASFLPAMLSQVESAIGNSRVRLRALGDERSTTLQQRAYLTKNAGILNDKLRHTLEGRVDAFELAFDGKSLRDKVRNENERFADNMIEKGHTWTIKTLEAIEELEVHDPDHEDQPGVALRNKTSGITEPYPVSRAAMLEYFTKAISQRPGRALRGTFDPIWVGTFFLQQSYKWKALVEAHMEKSFDIVATEVRSSVYTYLNDDTANALLEQIFEPSLRQRLERLQAKVEELLSPYTNQFPATLNRGYTKALLERGRKERSGPPIKEEEDEADLQFHAAAHILRCVKSYYDVAINVLLDNVQNLAIENVLLKDLDKIFVAESLAQMNDVKIAELAAESAEKAEERIRLSESIQDFEKAKQIILRQKSRTFAVVSASTPARSQNRSSLPSRGGQQASQPAVLPITGPEELDGDQGAIPQYPSLSDNLSSADGQKVTTKSKTKQSKPSIKGGSNQIDGDVFGETNHVPVAQQA